MITNIYTTLILLVACKFSAGFLHTINENEVVYILATIFLCTLMYWNLPKNVFCPIRTTRKIEVL